MDEESCGPDELPAIPDPDSKNAPLITIRAADDVPLRVLELLRNVLDLIEPHVDHYGHRTVSSEVKLAATSIGPSFCLVLEGQLEATVEHAGSAVLAVSDFLLVPSDTTVILSNGRRQTHSPDNLSQGDPPIIVTGRYAIGQPDDKLMGWLQIVPIILQSASSYRAGDLVVEQQRNLDGDFLDEELLSLFAKALANSVDECRRPGLLKALSSPPMASVIDQIQQHPEKHWTVGSMVSTFGFTRTLIFNAFDQFFASTPGEVVLAWRMALARKMIRSPDTRMEDIAHNVGFNSHHALSKAFKREFGISPSTYKTQQLGISRYDAAQINKLIAPVLTALDADLARDWHIDDFCSLLGISRSYFMKIFTDAVGVSPGKYLYQRRLDRAQELLDSGADIRQAADAVGYETTGALVRAIRNSGSRAASAGTHP